MTIFVKVEAWTEPRWRALLGLHGFSLRSVPSGFSRCRLAVARGNQFFLKLQPFVGCHGALFALGRRILEINACFRRRRCLSPRVHQ
jgi:hypothetical protein